MKRYMIFLALILLASIVLVVATQAQEVMKVTPGTTVKGYGNVSVVAVGLNIVNDGTISNTTDATMLFSGNGSMINGTGNTVFGKLLLQKNTNGILKLGQNIQVIDHVEFNSGLLDLGNYVLDLGSTGSFNGENENNRAFTDGNGYVQLTKTLNNISNVNAGNLGAVLSTTVNMGNVVIRRGGAAQSNLGPNNSIKRYFDILPQFNSSLNATLRFYYLNEELNTLNPSLLSLWKSTDNINWTAIGFTTSNTVDRYVEKTGIQSFSRWTLAPFAPITITPPSNITVNTDANVCNATVSLTGAYAATATGTPTPTIQYKIGGNVINADQTFPKGITTVTAIASNGVVDDAITSFTVTVLDKQKPIITCPTIALQCNTAVGTYQLPPLTASDNCGAPDISFSITGATTRSGNGNDASGSFNAGTNTIVWTATDASGNVSTCSSTVVVNGSVNAIVPDAFAVSQGGAPNTVFIGFAPKITLTGQPSGGSSPYSYKWTAGSSAGPALAQTASYTVSPTTTTTYYFNVKDKFGCSAPLVARTIEVVDVRCGTKLDKVTVCVLEKGVYTTSCLKASDVPSYLKSGSYLGACNYGIFTTARQNPIEERTGFEVKAFPNPSMSNFSLKVSSPNHSETIMIHVVDVYGRLVERKIINPEQIITLGNLYKPGIYFARIIQGKDQKEIKLIKLNR